MVHKGNFCQIHLYPILEFITRKQCYIQEGILTLQAVALLVTCSSGNRSYHPMVVSPQVVLFHTLGRFALHPMLFCLMSKSFHPMPKLFHPKCINEHLLCRKYFLKYSLLIFQTFFMHVRIAAR